MEKQILISTENQRAIDNRNIVNVIPSITEQNPFGGEKFCILVGQYDSQEFHKAQNRFRYAMHVEALNGNESLIHSASWVISELDDVKQFLKKFNRKTF